MSQCRIHRVQEENHPPMIGVVQVMFFIAKHPFLSITLLLTTFPETSECTVVGMDTSCVSIYFRKIRETSLSHLIESFYGEFFFLLQLEETSFLLSLCDQQTPNIMLTESSNNPGDCLTIISVNMIARARVSWLS